MILTVTLNPSVDHAIFLDQLKLHDTNRVRRTETDAGGKGVNLARVAAELGAETLATGFLGGGTGAYVRKVLDKQGVKHDFIEVDAETRTNFSVEDETDDPPTTFNEPGPSISELDLQALIDKCTEVAQCCQWAAMGGSLPPGVPTDIFAQLTRLFKERGCKVLVDADGEPLRLAVEAKPDMIKPNAKEAQRLLGREIGSREEAVEAARELHRSGIAVVIVSLGEDGAAFACEDGCFVAESPQVDVRSTIGSGDSMLGGILWALEDGRPLEEAFKWGVAAGAATATTDGSEIARRPVVLELLPQVRLAKV